MLRVGVCVAGGCVIFVWMCVLQVCLCVARACVCMLQLRACVAGCVLRIIVCASTAVFQNGVCIMCTIILSASHA